MTPPLLLGLDLGTTNAKAAVYALDGELVAEAAVGYPTYYPQPGWAEQRPAHWLTALTQACRQVMAAVAERRHAIAALALSAHGPGLVLLDAAGRSLLATSPTWQDMRCQAQGERLIASVGLGWAGFGMPHNGFPPKLLWALEERRAATERARWALGIKDYLAYWLTGETVTDPSTTAGGDYWWTPVYDACGWPIARLPHILPSGSVIGRVRPTLAEKLGLPGPLPVVNGLNDGASATLSMGALTPGDVVLTLATSGVLRGVLHQPLDAQVRLDHHLFFWPYLPGRWIAGGQIKSAASALQWWQGLQAEVPTADGFDQLLALAATSPAGSRGVRFLPYLLGRGSPQIDPTAQAAFLGLTVAHGPAEVSRAVLEGVAFAFRELADDFAQLGFRATQVRISGGGARSPLWRQILADVLALPLTYYAADSTLGAAIVAAVGAGLYPDIATAVAVMVRPLAVTEPQTETHAVYRAAYQEYGRLRDRLYPAK